jgi:phenylacetate-coenzyme A ligase PaaK-like adenylate-forming protein
MSFKSALFLWKYNVGKPGSIQYFRQLLANQTLPQEETDALRLKKLQQLVRVAYHKTKYYKRRFDEIGLHPEDITSLDTVTALPLLTRQDLTENFNDLISSDVERKSLNLVTTGGSTGVPVKVYHPRSVCRAAALWRMQSWWGIEPGADIATVYRESDALAQRIKKSLVSWPNRILLLDARRVDEKAARRFLRKFNRLRPPLLHGYAGALDALSSYVLDHGIDVWSPKAIWTTSSPLTRVQELRLQQAFNASVYDQYGCCEVYYLAAECPKKTGLHWFSDIRHIEFLDDSYHPCPEGVVGSVAITDFENLAFPLIRYLNGDRGRSMPGPCACGLTLPRMDKVRGRTTDLLRLPSGAVIAGDYMTTLFDAEPDAVRQFRVVQHKDYSIEIQVVPNCAFENRDTVFESVRQVVVKHAADEVPVTLTRHSSLEGKGGKLRYVVSEIPDKSERAG